MKLFKKLSSDTDVEWEFIDGSYVKTHQHNASELIKLLPQGNFVVADKGYDSEAIR